MLDFAMLRCMATSAQLKRENEQLKRQLQRRDTELKQRGAELQKLDADRSQHQRELAEANKKLEDQAAQFQQRVAEIEQTHRAEKEALQLEMKLLIERAFGSRSERYIDDPDQMKLDFASDDPQVEDAVEGLRTAVDEMAESERPTTKKARRKRNDERFPHHLDRKVVDVDLSDAEKEGLKYLGFDATEQLRMSPLKLWVVETRVHKYAIPGEPEAGVKTASAGRKGLVKGDRYDTSVAAEIITNRFGYHLPFYRQQDLFAGSGWTPSRSTLLNIQTSAALLVHSLAMYFADCVREDSCIGTDDTGVKLLLPKVAPSIDSNDPKSVRSHGVISEAIAEGRRHINAKWWAYRGVHVPLNVFDFTVSRHRDGPDLFLVEGGYTGTILGDCYGANTGIAMRSNGAITHAACVAHARRHVRDALANHPRHGQALMRMFGELYDIEDRCASADDDGRLELRQGEAKPVWDRMRDYIATETIDLVPKDKMKSAIGYLHNQWDALTRYLDDPGLPIDNNETEQLMKQIALGRKNWLFVGSVSAGYRSSDLMTLVSSAIRNDLHVWSYLKGVLDALLGGESDFATLRPDVWATSHPEHLRTYRQEERRDRQERKQIKRATRRRRKPARR